MDEIVKDHLPTLIIILSIAVAGIIGGLYKLGWIHIKSKKNQWDGSERRIQSECPDHPQLTTKVCSLYNKLDDLDKKLDTVSEKLQWVLGALEARWGRKLER